MPRLAATFSSTNGNYTISSGSSNNEVIGVVLRKEMHQIYQDGSDYVEGSTVRIKPSGVTATIASTAGATEEPDLILLHTGLGGSFTQSIDLTASSTYVVNDVIEAVITK